jgi:hypothetical protein
MPQPMPSPMTQTMSGNVALYNSSAVTLATFFGTPAAGSVLMAINYQRLGEKANAVLAVVLGFLVTGLALGFGYVLPNGVGYPLGLGLLVGMRLVATKLQGEAVARHVSQGGRLGSKWVAFGVGMAFLCVIFAVVFTTVYVGTTHNKVVVGTKDEVYFRGSATKQEAQSLGDALKKGGYFKDRGTTVFLEKGKDGTSISLVLREGAWDEPGMLATEEEAMREVADSVGGLPIHVKLMNSMEQVKKEGVVGRASVDGKDEVFYFGQATEAEGLALCRSLTTEQYFSGRGASVMFSKDGDGAVMSFVVADGFWEDASHVAGFEAVVRAVAPSVGGLPIKLRLVTTALDDKKDVVVQ